MFDAPWFDRLQAHSAGFAGLAVLLAAALAAWLGARLFWLLLAGPTLPVAAAPTLDSVVGPAPTAAVTVSRWHLFGNPGASLDAARLAAQAPATALKLVLRGTLNEDAPEGGIAIIADESGAERRYRVGDPLPGDARLEAIYAGRVLLTRAGVSESLSLPLPGEGGASGPATTRRAATASPAPARPGAPAPFVNPLINPGAPSMESLRAATGTDIAELARQVSVLPVLENGRFAGVRLSVGRDSDLLARSGLKTTDIITAVNGIPLDGPQRQGELLEALKHARQFTVTVRRDGQTLQLPIGL